MKLSTPLLLWSIGASVANAATLRSSSKKSIIESNILDLKTASFSFVEGQTHSISDGTVDQSFCDRSSPKSMSGYMDITADVGDDKHYFYWMFEKRADEVASDTSIPFILWLTGGPGCSSSLALLTENGPCTVNKDKSGQTIYNPHSWVESAHMLWLDQPANVGFSYGDATDRDETKVQEDAYYFLQAFFKAHPEYSQNPLYIFGESFGGHYAPVIAHRVYMGNKSLKEGDGLLHLNLQGLAVGNGLTNSKVQIKYYPEMAFKNPHGIQAVSEEQYEEMKAAIPECMSKIDACETSAPNSLAETFNCQSAFAVCSQIEGAYYQSGLNPYDMRIKCDVPGLCYDFSHVSDFMNMVSTRTALHVSDHAPEDWATCNNMINGNWQVKDRMKSFVPEVQDLLDNAQIPVLIYAGDVDYICNYMGNKAWTLEMDWKYKDEFNAASDETWGSNAGLVRTSHNLTFLQVFDAGHMVPTDQPENALYLVNDFLEGNFKDTSSSSKVEI